MPLRFLLKVLKGLFLFSFPILIYVYLVFSFLCFGPSLIPYFLIHIIIIYIFFYLISSIPFCPVFFYFCFNVLWVFKSGLSSIKINIKKHELHKLSHSPCAPTLECLKLSLHFCSFSLSFPLYISRTPGLCLLLFPNTKKRRRPSLRARYLLELALVILHW